MYLSKLKLLGFKSFAQKTQLEFTEGISTIIGPNGSGKSNIVDAIRWVLGEQRSSTLRSEKMENVIFNGSTQRKPMGMAEVSMVLENNKGILKTEFNEVVITRRLYRSGESQYLINNTPVRLKDVVDLFMDTGLGPNSYSVIELKMVEGILSESKTERRQLLEEAAGVVKYKIRRKSALRKLEATRADLTRLYDIIAEVQKTVNSLSRQVGKARRYLNYTEELKKLEIDLARYRYHHLLDEIRPLKQQLQDISKLKEETHHQITIDEALLEDYKRERVEIEKELQSINQQLHQLDQQVAVINQQQAVDETRSEEMLKTRTRYLGEIEDFKKRIQILKETLVQFQGELDELTAQKEEAESQFSAIEQERKNELEKLQQEKQEIDRLNQEFKNRFQQVSALKDQLQQLQFQLNFKKEQLEELENSTIEHQAQIKQLQEKRTILEEEKNNLLKRREDIKEQIEQLNAKEQTLNQQLEQLNQQKRQILTELDQYRSRLQFFEQIITRYEGHSISTQFIMGKKEQFPGLIGPLSDVFTVDEPLSRTVEMLLSQTLDYILVETVQDARKIIQLIKKENKGRITLIPLDRISKIPHQAVIPQDLKPLTDFIHTSAPYQKLFDLLLGDIVVSDNLEEALQLAEKHPHLRIITAQGEIISFNREITAGTTSQQKTAILGRKEQYKKYQKLVAEKEKALQHTQQKLNETSAQLEENTQKRAQLNTQLNQLYEDSLDKEKQENQVAYQINQLRSQEKQREEQIIRLKKEVKEHEQRIQKLQVELEQEQQQLNELEKETIQRTSRYEQNNDLLQDLLDEVQQARISVTNLKNQVENRERDLQRTQQEISTLEQRLKHHQQEIEQIDQQIIKIEQDSKNRRQALENIWKERDKLDEQKNKVDQHFQEIQAKIIDLEEQTKQYRKQHDSTLEKSRQLELKINEYRYKAETLREQMLKEYAEDIEIGFPYEGLNEQESEERIEILKQRIKNLGPVNPLAVTEYEKEKERLDFLTQQRDDLLEAEKSLLETIDKINKTARQQFLETFNAIKENFEKVFKSFFEKGEGTIQLEEGVDPLEADIQIQVRTKGRKLQTLTLLSGGEKTLTAISLLFAIYLVKPSPFCILDEVDAPLDDVNIGRFTQALKEFSKNTQFIIITHNKRTMEASDTMYGVTMEEEGVSKLVSVKFS